MTLMIDSNKNIFIGNFAVLIWLFLSIQLKNEHNSRNKETYFIFLLLLNTIKNCSDINLFD